MKFISLFEGEDTYLISRYKKSWRHDEELRQRRTFMERRRVESGRLTVPKVTEVEEDDSDAYETRFIVNFADGQQVSIWGDDTWEYGLGAKNQAAQEAVEERQQALWDSNNKFEFDDNAQDAIPLEPYMVRCRDDLKKRIEYLKRVINEYTEQLSISTQEYSELQGMAN
jgi:hypothetical protein